MNKLIKKEIYADIKNYEEGVVREIIEENWSTRRAKKAIRQGTYILAKVKNNAGIEIYNRKEIVQEATKFYKNLYSEETDDARGEEGWGKNICNLKDIPPYLLMKLRKYYNN